MLIGRTTGTASVVPELVYADVVEAVQWLCETSALPSCGGPTGIAPDLRSAMAW
jgi:hypothetical protein